MRILYLTKENNKDTTTGLLRYMQLIGVRILTVRSLNVSVEEAKKQIRDLFPDLIHVLGELDKNESFIEAGLKLGLPILMEKNNTLEKEDVFILIESNDKIILSFGQKELYLGAKDDGLNLIENKLYRIKRVYEFLLSE